MPCVSYPYGLNINFKIEKSRSYTSIHSILSTFTERVPKNRTDELADKKIENIRQQHFKS